MGTTTSHELRCPVCGAQTPATADWCTLCYADRRPPQEPELPELPAQAAQAVATVQAAPTAPAASPGTTTQVTAGSRGKHARRATPDSASYGGVGRELPAHVDVDLMLAQLAAETSAPLGPLGPLGSVMDRFDTKGSAVLVICGGVLAVGALILVVMTIMGSLL